LEIEHLNAERELKSLRYARPNFVCLFVVITLSIVIHSVDLYRERVTGKILWHVIKPTTVDVDDYETSAEFFHNLQWRKLQRIWDSVSFSVSSRYRWA